VVDGDKDGAYDQPVANRTANHCSIAGETQPKSLSKIHGSRCAAVVGRATSRFCDNSHRDAGFDDSATSVNDGAVAGASNGALTTSADGRQLSEPDGAAAQEFAQRV
jgi:hypothetical protein